MRNVLMYGAAMLLAAMAAGCSSDDPNYDAVTPPVVAVAPNTLSGFITDMQGNAVSGAKVEFGSEKATTDQNGAYMFNNVNEGTYTISASADGMVGKSSSIVVKKSSVTQHLVWSASLAKNITKEVNVTTDEGGDGTVESDAVKNNNPGKVDITVSVPSDAVSEDAKVTLTPIYTEESAASRSIDSRAAEEHMLIGARLASSNSAVKLSKAVDLKFALDNSIAESAVTKKYVDGKWVDAPSAVVDGDVIISANEFTSYGIFLKVTVSEKTSTDALSFAQDEWNNLYGNSDMNIHEASFGYKVGSEINSTATNKLEGLLIEYLARLKGMTVKNMTGTYPIDVTLPIGTKLVISGAQEKTTTTVSGNGKSVSGTTYGTTNIKVTTTNRADHNGGGN